MAPILQVDGFDAAYGAVPVVRAVSFALAPGEIVALLGRNGMGKTTLLRGILGLVPVRRGMLRLGGTEITRAEPEQVARAGVGYVPADRGIFGSLSVRENLVMCARPGSNAGSSWTLDRVLALFPRLAERIKHGGHHLSGGEQQMLSIGRALMTNPRLLLIDEATEGLAPLIARDIWKTLGEVCRSGVTTMIVDRDVRRLARLVDRSIVLFKGEIVFDGTPDVLLGDEALVQRYIGL
jgi:branched-chain amino acid transport system ATP-binding protein